jgi:hypothetical protein
LCILYNIFNWFNVLFIVFTRTAFCVYNSLPTPSCLYYGFDVEEYNDFLGKNFDYDSILKSDINPEFLMEYILYTRTKVELLTDMTQIIEVSPMSESTNSSKNETEDKPLFFDLKCPYKLVFPIDHTISLDQALVYFFYKSKIFLRTNEMLFASTILDDCLDRANVMHVVRSYINE